MANKANARKTKTNRRAASRKSKSKSKSASKRGAPPAKSTAARSDLWREVSGVLLLGFSIFLFVALISLQLQGSHWMGPFGHAVAGFFFAVIGISSYLACASFAYLSTRLLRTRETLMRPNTVFGLVLCGLSIGILAHLIGDGYRVNDSSLGGGLGEGLAEVFRAALSTAGAALLAIIGLATSVVVATPLRMRQLGGILGRVLAVAFRHVANGLRRAGTFCVEVWHAILPEKRDEDDDELYEDLDLDHDDPPILAADGAAVAVMSAEDTERLDAKEMARRIAELDETKRKADEQRFEMAITSALDDIDPEPKKSKRKKRAKGTPARGVPAFSTELEVSEGMIADEDAAFEQAALEECAVIEEQVHETSAPTTTSTSETATEKPAKRAKGTKSDADGGPVIVESKYKNNKGEAEQLDFLALTKDEYKFPPIDLLNCEKSDDADLNRDEMLELSAKLEQTLQHYGVKGEVVAIRPGPVVTMYEFAPAPGTRLNKIVNLQDDLAMALEAFKVRIVAPIPGKAAVGIEVPNNRRENVYLKEIIASKKFQSSKTALPLALGKDIEGGPAVVDLAKMPHLLVAGTTGSGKSVSVNSMITSLLYSCTPEEVRMIMVDPKMLELSIYDGVPHLLLPVVTDPKKANLALRWSVEEMERRYDLLANAGVRDIRSYNRKMEKELKKLEDAEQETAAGALDSWENESDAWEDTGKHLKNERPTKLPYIVIVIDEFADLMMCAAKEVETSVARIAQKARAAGIHLILATQRPSVDVITGLIKANFPSRAAFRVTSKVDSRTILDQSGAESLLGAGDMLFSDRGTAPRRFHGCFVDEEEIHQIVEFLKQQGQPVYNLDIIKPRVDDTSGASGEDVDEMYDRAVQLVTDSGQASISMVQRKLRVGYNRAARMIEAMEDAGIVGPPDNKNRRQVIAGAAVAS